MHTLVLTLIRTLLYTLIHIHTHIHILMYTHSDTHTLTHVPAHMLINTHSCAHIYPHLYFNKLHARATPLLSYVPYSNNATEQKWKRKRSKHRKKCCYVLGARGGLRALTWELTVSSTCSLVSVRALHEAVGASLVNIEALVYFVL